MAIVVDHAPVVCRSRFRLLDVSDHVAPFEKLADRPVGGHRRRWVRIRLHCRADHSGCLSSPRTIFRLECNDEVLYRSVCRCDLAELMLCCGDRAPACCRRCNANVVLVTRGEFGEFDVAT